MHSSLLVGISSGNKGLLETVVFLLANVTCIEVISELGADGTLGRTVADHLVQFISNGICVNFRFGFGFGFGFGIGFGIGVGGCDTSSVSGRATCSRCRTDAICMVPLAHSLIEFCLPLLVRNLVTTGLITKVAFICPLAVIIVTLGIILILEAIQLGVEITHLIPVSAVVLILLRSQKGILILQGIALHLVLAHSQLVQLRHFVIELLKVALISLLAYGLCVGIAIAAGHGLRLTHGIHHGLLTLSHILILVLLVQGIAVQVIGERFPVQDLLDCLIQLGLPCGLVLSGLLGKLLLEQSLRLLHRVTLLIGAGVRGRDAGGIGGSCTGGIRFRQRTPGVVAHNAVHIQIVFLLIIFDCGLGLGTEVTVRVQSITVLIALTWDDLDLQAQEISVTKSLDYTVGSNPKVKPPKTDAGYRTVPIIDILLPYLQEQKKTSASQYVFPAPPSNRGGEGGGLMTLRGYEGAWMRYCQTVGFIDSDGKPSLGAHNLRHGTATLMFELDVDVYTTQRLLGHSRVEVTQEIYTELRANQKKKSVDKFNAGMSKYLA